MHSYLQRQELEYGIYISEQEGDQAFNKGILMNTAFNHIFKDKNDYDCVLFHDVDLIPTGSFKQFFKFLINRILLSCFFIY